MSLPPGAVSASMPRDVRLQIVTACKRPPVGDGWLHEIKHDGQRLARLIRRVAGWQANRLAGAGKARAAEASVSPRDLVFG
jgi:hypothetical protein